MHLHRAQQLELDFGHALLHVQPHGRHSPNAHPRQQSRVVYPEPGSVLESNVDDVAVFGPEATDVLDLDDEVSQDSNRDQDQRADFDFRTHRLISAGTPGVHCFERPRTPKNSGCSATLRVSRL